MLIMVNCHAPGSGSRTAISMPIRIDNTVQHNSGMFIPDPDPDFFPPNKKKQQKRRGKIKKKTYFLSINTFHRIEYYLISGKGIEKDLSQLTKNLNIFYLTKTFLLSSQNSKGWTRDPRSGIRKKLNPDLDLGVKKSPDP